MFDNFICFAASGPESTICLVDGADVRYLASFCNPHSMSVSSVACAVVHPGANKAVALSVCEHRHK